MIVSRHPRRSLIFFLPLRSPIPRPRPALSEADRRFRPCREGFPNSFRCHRSEKAPVSPTIATDPKTHLSKSCICHTSETPQGNLPIPIQRTCPAFSGRTARATLPTRHRLRPSPLFPISYSHCLSSFFSNSSTLFCTIFHAAKLNSFLFNRFRTLCTKHTGVGEGGRGNGGLNRELA